MRPTFELSISRFGLGSVGFNVGFNVGRNDMVGLNVGLGEDVGAGVVVGESVVLSVHEAKCAKKGNGCQ